jgi:hypothetical protein
VDSFFCSGPPCSNIMRFGGRWSVGSMMSSMRGYTGAEGIVIEIGCERTCNLYFRFHESECCSANSRLSSTKELTSGE